MKYRYTFVFVFFTSLLSAEQANANVPPGPQTLLPVILMIPLLIAFSALGGAYDVLRRNGVNTEPIWLIFIALFFSMISAGFSVIVIYIFSVLVFIRVIKMIGWGIQAKTKKHEHLQSVNSSRMIASACVLFFVSAFLSGLGVTSAGNPIKQRDGEKAGENFKEYIAYNIAYSQILKEKTGEAGFKGITKTPSFLFRKITEKTSTYLAISNSTGISGSGIEIEYNPDMNKFVAYRLPFHDFPVFPFNYFNSQPSFRSDESGKIRMIFAHNSKEKCPANAPVVMKVSKDDIEKVKPMVIDDHNFE